MAIEAKSPRFLIVRRDNIGDLVCTTPLIDALRERFPTAWLGALVNTYNAEVLARNPALDCVYAYEKLKHRQGSLVANVIGRLQLGARLRAEKLDAVLVPSATPQSLRIAAALRPKKLIAGDSSAPGARHEVERAFALGASLGVHGTPGPMRIYPDIERAAQLKKRFSLERPLVAVHISARRPAQRWPIERYRELVIELSKTTRVLLLWAPGTGSNPRHPGDDDAAEEIPAGESVVKLATPDLATLIAALSLADSVICPDGGALHIAAALGKPIVALFGDSPVERWRPWGVPHRVLQPPSGVLAGLPLSALLDAYHALIVAMTAGGVR
jgi:ADP-heptose:LPS heptosyltransferase